MQKPSPKKDLKNFNFVASTFVLKGYEEKDGQWSDEDLLGLKALKGFYPELSHWGMLPLGCAFADFSADVYHVTWAEWQLLERDEIFLEYCHSMQTQGFWKPNT